MNIDPLLLIISVIFGLFLALILVGDAEMLTAKLMIKKLFWALVLLGVLFLVSTAMQCVNQ